MLKMIVMFRQALWTVKNQKGAVAIEYGLLVAVIALGLLGVMGTFANGVTTWFGTIVNGLPKVNAAS